MKQVVNAIQGFDQIGPQITFKYQEKTRVQTVLGGVLTTVMIVVGALGFIYFSRDMFFRTNPITKANTLISDEKVLSFFEYPTSITITDVFFRPIPKGTALYNSFEIFPQFWFTSVGDNGIELQTGYFGLVPCTVEYFGKFGEVFANNSNGYSQCVDYTKAYNLDGTPADVDPSFYKKKYENGEGSLDVKLRLCDESKNPDCSKPFLQAGQVQFLVTNLKEYINFDNHSNPIERRLDVMSGSVAAGLFTRKNLSITYNQLITDDGYILSNTSTINYMMTFLSDNTTTSFNKVTRNLYAYTYNIDIAEEILERRYVKIQEILANIGGFMKLLFFIASLLTKHFALYSFYRSFGKEINRFTRETEGKKRSVNNLIQPSEKCANQSNTEIMSNNVVRSPSINAEVGFFAFFSSLLFSKKKDSDIEKVFSFLDISYLSKKMIEVEAFNKLNS